MDKSKVFDAVNECLEKYIGGEIFFDELDAKVKFNREILKEFIDKVRKEFEGKNVYTIASGEFGLCLHNFGLPVDFLVQGGLRKGNTISDLSHFIQVDSMVVFLDDSYFSGKTAEVVKREIQRCGALWGGVYCIYDGSQNPIHKVNSVYRYYDHYDILGNKIK